MNHKFTTSMLLIGAVLLGVFIWFFERESETSSQEAIRNQMVFAVYPSSITRILTERDGAEIECTKASGNWRLTRPADAPVDTGVVERMIAGMARVERGELITADTLKERGLTPADYGFDEPRARITYQNNRGSFTWLIGRDAPLGENLYVMAEGQGDIISAPQTLLHLIPEDASWIRDRTLFHAETAAVRGIDLRRPTGFLQLRHPESNGWIMLQPHKGRADILNIHALIETILTARIDQFITDEKTDLTVYNLEEPDYELTLFTQDEQTQTLRIGKPHPDQPDTRYAKWVESDSVFTVPAEWVQLLDQKDDPLRNRHILGVLPARITKLQIARGEQRVDLTKTNEQWNITRPAQWEAEPSQVQDLLQTLAQAVVLDFVDNPSPEQQRLMSNAVWTIHFVANGKTNQLQISEVGSDGHRLVQRTEESTLYSTDADLIRETFASPLFFKNRTVLQINPSQIEKIVQQSGENECRVQSTENTFTAADRTQRLDSEALFELTTELTALNTKRYVAFNPDALEPYGLSEPPFRLTITLSGTDTLGRVILLGKTTDEGRFAMVQGQDIVFVLSDETAQALTRNLTQSVNPEMTKHETPNDEGNDEERNIQ